MGVAEDKGRLPDPLDAARGGDASQAQLAHAGFSRSEVLGFGRARCDTVLVCLP